MENLWIKKKTFYDDAEMELEKLRQMYKVIVRELRKLSLKSRNTSTQLLACEKNQSRKIKEEIVEKPQIITPQKQLR